MYTSHEPLRSQPARREPDRSGDGRTIARRAGLVLVAAAALAAIGTAVSIAWVVDAGVVLAIATIATVLVRRARGKTGRGCRRCC